MVGTLSLVPQIVDVVSISVIAAGGIMDGRGVLVSIVLGAEAVSYIHLTLPMLLRVFTLCLVNVSNASM
ncbi:hypothetical protein B8A19_15810 [Staphylococcus aureus]|nr:hypothetical protein B8A19_15810 [Staphylococcus aureus]